MAENEPSGDSIGRLAGAVTRNRMDPDRMEALKRSLTGMTRCPVCDSLNPADHKFCEKCGAYLYPEMRYEDEEKGVDRNVNEIKPNEE
jgi:hypothetical protein